MIRLIHSAILWAKIRRTYLAGEYDAAATFADEYRSRGIIDPVFEALDATLDVLTHKSDAALKKFSAIVENVQGKPRRKDSEFIENYCMYYISLIEDGDAESYRRRAISSPGSKMAKRSLPLPEHG